MNTRTFLLLSAPTVLAMLVLMAYPLIDGAWLSLHGFTFRGDLRWLGFENYRTVFADEAFWQSVWFTLLVCIVTVPASIGLGFASALLLDELPRWLRGAVTACVLLPFIVTPVVGTLAFSWLFRDFGIVTYWLRSIGLDIAWMGSETASRSLVLMQWTWHAFPFAALVLFAGLQAVPPEQIEAAKMDGAHVWRRLWHVLIPHLRPLFVFLAVIMVMDAYRVFDSIAVMTKGINGTESVMWYSYRIAILENALTRGAAVAFLTVIGVLFLLAPFLWLTWQEQKALRR